MNAEREAATKSFSLPSSASKNPYARIMPRKASSSNPARYWDAAACAFSYPFTTPVVLSDHIPHPPSSRRPALTEPRWASARGRRSPYTRWCCERAAREQHPKAAGPVGGRQRAVHHLGRAGEATTGSAEFSRAFGGPDGDPVTSRNTWTICRFLSSTGPFAPPMLWASAAAGSQPSAPPARARGGPGGFVVADRPSLA
jgi:hypothetical protein